MFSNTHFNKLLILLFLVLFAMMQLFVKTSRLSLLPDPYYYIYEHSTNMVIVNGHLGVLRITFDNFASSPGTVS